MRGHENTSTTLLIGALTAQTGDFAILINLVVFQHSQLDLLLLVLVLLWGGVVLLLALLGTSSEAKHQVKCGFLLDVVVTQSATIFQLFASEDQPLLVWGDTLLILDLCLHILNSVTCLYLKGNGLTREGFYKNLHGCRPPCGVSPTFSVSVYCAILGYFVHHTLLICTPKI